MKDAQEAPLAPNQGVIRKVLFSPNVGHVGVLVFFLCAGYFFGVRGLRFFLVPSKSMEPTLLVGDQVATFREDEYHRGDIIVLHDSFNGEFITKRLIGLPGDVIQVKDGVLFIDSMYASEPYLVEPMDYLLMDPIHVLDGQVFLLGDNRNRSEDSHIDGSTYPKEDIIGRVVMVYYPYERFGKIASYPLTNALGK